MNKDWNSIWNVVLIWDILKVFRMWKVCFICGSIFWLCTGDSAYADPRYQKLHAPSAPFWSSGGIHLVRSAMDATRPGDAAELITADPAPGKYEGKEIRLNTKAKTLLYTFQFANTIKINFNSTNNHEPKLNPKYDLW